MGSGTVSHNTGAMRNWSSNMSSNAEEYDALISRLYSLIEELDFNFKLIDEIAINNNVNIMIAIPKFPTYP